MCIPMKTQTTDNTCDSDNANQSIIQSTLFKLFYFRVGVLLVNFHTVSIFFSFLFNDNFLC